MPYNEKDLINNNKGKSEEIKLDFVRSESFGRIVLYALDTILLSLSFLFFSLGGSAFINSFICQRLNGDKSDIHLFFETTFESLVIIFYIYILIFYVPKIPSIVPFPNREHIKFRILCRHAVVGAAVIFAHQRLFNKYQFLLGIDDIKKRDINV